MINGEATLLVSMEMDGVLLWMTGRILGVRTSPVRIVAAAMLGALPTLWILTSQNFYAVPWGLVIVWPVLLLAVALSPLRSRRRWMTAYAILISGTIAVGGLGLLLLTWVLRLLPGVAPFYWLAIGVPSIVVGVTLGMPHLKHLHEVSLGSLGDVRLVLNGKSLTVHALWDSGNQVRDPVLRRPVIIVETQVLIEWVPLEVLSWVVNVTEGNLLAPPPDWQSKLGVLDFHSVGGSGKMPVLAVDRADALKGGALHHLVPVMVGFIATPMTADGAYHALINPGCIANTLHARKEEVGA